MIARASNPIWRKTVKIMALHEAEAGRLDVTFTSPGLPPAR
jgi:hypothetical protein